MICLRPVNELDFLPIFFLSSCVINREYAIWWQLENLRTQTAEQEATLKAQEDDLMSKKQELEGLKEEERRLAAQQESFRARLDTLTKNLQDSQLHISQVIPTA